MQDLGTTKTKVGRGKKNAASCPMRAPFTQRPVRYAKIRSDYHNSGSKNSFI